MVYHLLERGVEVFRIDPTVDGTLPQCVSVSSGPPVRAVYDFVGKPINPLECSGVLCRFALESLVASSDDPLINFTQSESLTAFLAPLRMIESSRWINDPWAESRADCKILQAQIAERLGLKIPDFIISSNYDDILAFYKEHGGAVIKSLSDSPLARVKGEYVAAEKLFTDDFSAPYTAVFKPLGDDEVKRLDGTPMFLQQAIEKQADIRATVIDGKVFAAEMPFCEGAQIDFRLNSNKVIRKYELPADIEERLARLVRELGVRFASCDLALSEDGDIYFLEANVQGNYLWTEQGAGLPISKSVAEALVV